MQTPPVLLPSPPQWGWGSPDPTLLFLLLPTILAGCRCWAHTAGESAWASSTKLFTFLKSLPENIMPDSFSSWRQTRSNLWYFFLFFSPYSCMDLLGLKGPLDHLVWPWKSIQLPLPPCHLRAVPPCQGSQYFGCFFSAVLCSLLGAVHVPEQ